MQGSGSFADLLSIERALYLFELCNADRRGKPVSSVPSDSSRAS